MDAIIKYMNQKDIETLEREFAKISGVWEYEDGDAYACFHLARKELELVKIIAERHYIKLEYDPSKFECDEWWGDDDFSCEDFEKNNVTVDNYGKADAVAFEMKEMLVKYLV